MAKITNLSVTVEISGDRLEELARFACSNHTQLTEAELAELGIDFEATVAKVIKDAAFRKAVTTAVTMMVADDVADYLLDILDSGANIPSLTAYEEAQETWLDQRLEITAAKKLEEAAAMLKKAGYTVSKKKA